MWTWAVRNERGSLPSLVVSLERFFSFQRHPSSFHETEAQIKSGKCQTTTYLCIRIYVSSYSIILWAIRCVLGNTGFVPNSYFFSRIKTGWSFLTNRTNSDPNFSERYRTAPVEILQWAAHTTLTICVEWVGEHDSSLSIKAELIWDNWDVTGHLDTSAGACCA